MEEKKLMVASDSSVRIERMRETTFDKSVFRTYIKDNSGDNSIVKGLFDYNDVYPGFNPVTLKVKDTQGNDKLVDTYAPPSQSAIIGDSDKYLSSNFYTERPCYLPNFEREISQSKSKKKLANNNRLYSYIYPLCNNLSRYKITDYMGDDLDISQGQSSKKECLIDHGRTSLANIYNYRYEKSTDKEYIDSLCTYYLGAGSSCISEKNSLLKYENNELKWTSNISPNGKAKVSYTTTFFANDCVEFSVSGTEGSTFEKSVELKAGNYCFSFFARFKDSLSYDAIKTSATEEPEPPELRGKRIYHKNGYENLDERPYVSYKDSKISITAGDSTKSIDITNEWKRFYIPFEVSSQQSITLRIKFPWKDNEFIKICGLLLEKDRTSPSIYDKEHVDYKTIESNDAPVIESFYKYKPIALLIGKYHDSTDINYLQQGDWTIKYQKILEISENDTNSTFSDYIGTNEVSNIRELFKEATTSDIDGKTLDIYITYSSKDKTLTQIGYISGKKYSHTNEGIEVGSFDTITVKNYKFNLMLGCNTYEDKFTSNGGYYRDLVYWPEKLDDSEINKIHNSIISMNVSANFSYKGQRLIDTSTSTVDQKTYNEIKDFSSGKLKDTYKIIDIDKESALYRLGGVENNDIIYCVTGFGSKIEESELPNYWKNYYYDNIKTETIEKGISIKAPLIIEGHIS